MIKAYMSILNRYDKWSKKNYRANYIAFFIFTMSFIYAKYHNNNIDNIYVVYITFILSIIVMIASPFIYISIKNVNLGKE